MLPTRVHHQSKYILLCPTYAVFFNSNTLRQKRVAKHESARKVAKLHTVNFNRTYEKLCSVWSIFARIYIKAHINDDPLFSKYKIHNESI